MAVQGFLVGFSLVFFCAAATCYATTFSSLQHTLVVSTSAKQGQVLKAGEDEITVMWSINASLPAMTDSDYRKVEAKLCYAPISQQDRAWRKTVDDLSKDKTCQHNIVSRPYSPSNKTFTWTVQKDVPSATYFIRAYAYNSAGDAVAYGQTTDIEKATNLFNVRAISGRHTSLDIASVCFSAFSMASLLGFFFLDKRNAKSS